MKFGDVAHKLLEIDIVILVLAVLGRLPAKLGPGTRSHGSRSTNRVERIYNPIPSFPGPNQNLTCKLAA